MKSTKKCNKKGDNVKLKTWMKRNNITIRKMAKDLKISHNSVFKYQKGETSPNIKNALKIEKYTNGQVTIKDLA